MNERQTILINICSGKSAVGKSFVASNFAYILSTLGHSVLLWDGDYNQSMQNYLFGVKPTYGVIDLLEKNLEIEDVAHKLDENLYLLTNLSRSNHNLKSNQDNFLKIIQKIKKTQYFDFIIYDSSSELSNDFLKSIKSSNMLMLLINDDPLSVIDGYALLKIIKNHKNEDKIKLLINNTVDEADAINMEQKLNSVNKKFLNLKIEKIGFLPYDRQVRSSVINQNIFVKYNIDNELHKSFVELANTIDEQFFVLQD